MTMPFVQTAMFSALRGTSRLLSTSASVYPFSKSAIKLESSPVTESLRRGKGIMQHIHKTLPPPNKQELLATLFSRKHPKCLVVGSVLTVFLQHSPATFSGVLISIRRRGPDTSFVLRNVVHGTGVEMQFFVGSPHLKDIKVVHRAGDRGSKRMRRAKLFYLRDSPDKMTALASGSKK